MSFDWTDETLGDLISRDEAHLQTGPFGTALKASEYSEDGVPLISVREIREGFLQIVKDTPRVCEATTQRLPKFLLQQGDIVFGRKGAVDRNAVISFEQEGWFLGSDGIRLRLSNKYDSLFFSYLMRSSATRAWLLQNSEGTTMLSLNQKTLARVPVRYPTVEIQKRISTQLRTLDDKITLNIKINQTLEEMAQAIFKSWFVDFDPVKAKMNGEQPKGMDAATASLFPEKLVESELGLIPEGWEVKPLDKIAHFENGLALQKFRPESEDDDFLPVLKIAQLRQGYCDGKEKARTDIKESCRVYNGDMIFSWSGTLMIDLWTGGKAALNQHLFKVTSKDYTLPLYLYWTKHHLVKFQQIAKDKAVTMGHIKRGHLSESLCVVPPKDLRDKMDEILMPLINQGLNMRLQSNQLATLRDTLLPKLLSGEIELVEQS
ncbi:restriction endonuclease subunit S [Vibrio fluvialis]